METINDLRGHLQKNNNLSFHFYFANECIMLTFKWGLCLCEEETSKHIFQSGSIDLDINHHISYG